MNPLTVLQASDPELYDYFAREFTEQHSSLSFIPDENTTSPMCAAIMGHMLVNSSSKVSLSRTFNLSSMTAARVCELFHAEHANIRTITIEAASRVVFRALTQRGDVVMSLDLRKKEHCNNENFAFRFASFGVDPKTQKIDLGVFEKEVLMCMPRLIIVSPINYPLNIDYERMAAIAHASGALLWCDISQIAGLVAAGQLNSPLPHADVVTFTIHGALQGPQSSIILCSNRLAGVIDRAVTTSGHSGLLKPQLAALACRIHEMQDPSYGRYAEAVVDNARALAEGLQRGGASILSGGTQSHLVVVDCKNTAMSARGAQDTLADCGVRVRICDLLTSDPMVKFDAIRFSSLPATTRGMGRTQMENLGVSIAETLLSPDETNVGRLQSLVKELTRGLPVFSAQWLTDDSREAVAEYNSLLDRFV